MRVLGVAFLTCLVNLVNPDVRMPEHNEALHDRFIRACSTSVTYDRVVLKRITLLSKYIFTGKVYGVSSSRNGTKIYKVNIRRVLKGDLNDVGVKVRFSSAKSIKFSDATVLVEGPRVKCPSLRVRTYAIFLTEKKREEGALKLSLVVEPVLLTLRNIEIIEAAIKGKLFDTRAFIEN
ncbi:hypothetical protein O0L34_g9715 [Tuta absoluta]|nr:hypothetical protein O0L34_g9715 [Tuta absoluta]